MERERERERGGGGGGGGGDRGSTSNNVYIIKCLTSSLLTDPENTAFQGLYLPLRVF